MDHQSRYAIALEQAARTLGGEAKLARFLRVGIDDLRHWIKSQNIPLQVFLASLDVIADGPFAPRKRPIRVACIDDRKKFNPPATDLRAANEFASDQTEPPDNEPRHGKNQLGGTELLRR